MLKVQFLRAVYFCLLLSVGPFSRWWKAQALELLPVLEKNTKGPAVVSRRGALARSTFLAFSTASASCFTNSIGTTTAWAYQPDPDKLQESLYLISRVQEATVQQERFVNNSSSQEELKGKMKLTLKLVEKNYLLLDQINFCSTFIPMDDVVAASAAGYNAVEALQTAIDYVNQELATGPLTSQQQRLLSQAMQTTRSELFTFLDYMPVEKLQNARKRVETENVSNREEYGGDGSEGVYNPVVLPWKTR